MGHQNGKPQKLLTLIYKPIFVKQERFLLGGGIFLKIQGLSMVCYQTYPYNVGFFSVFNMCSTFQIVILGMLCESHMFYPSGFYLTVYLRKSVM